MRKVFNTKVSRAWRRVRRQRCYQTAPKHLCLYKRHSGAVFGEHSIVATNYFTLNIQIMGLLIANYVVCCLALRHVERGALQRILERTPRFWVVNQIVGCWKSLPRCVSFTLSLTSSTSFSLSLSPHFSFSLDRFVFRSLIRPQIALLLLTHPRLSFSSQSLLPDTLAFTLACPRKILSLQLQSKV